MNKALQDVRQKMKAYGIDLLFVPTDDFHQSEYVGPYFECRKFLTGFTGSAGVAVVTEEKAGLWTDGRYFLQAADELEGSEFTLYKMGVEGVPRVTEFVESELPEGGVIGYDGRVVAAALGEKFSEIAEKKGGKVVTEHDVVGEVWQDRPQLSCEPAWVLDECYAGESAESKLKRIREEMQKAGADVHVVASLDDIMWTLNLRGDDVAHSPVVLSYLLLTLDDCTFFVQENAINEDVAAYLGALQVQTAPYNALYGVLEALSEEKGHTVLLSKDCVNDRIFKALAGCRIINKANPAMLLKCVKNETELRNIVEAHIKDGVQMTKWLYWFKTHVGKEPMTECSVAKKLDDMRRSVDTNVDLSFDTIAGYGPNGAIVHYEPVEGKDAEIFPRSFLLVDCGGHYLEGSTDITRTIACGPLTEKEKAYFTLVLRGHLNLANARFLEGCTGVSLDYLAREPLWQNKLDYRHGTGHGIGYLLNVHEGPNGFRYRIVPERVDSETFREGMVTTDEPGIYETGEFGVRTESVLICRKGEKNDYGQFYYFENVTLCPIDLDAVVPEMLSSREKDELNAYHEKVYAVLSPYMTERENEWLRNATRKI